MMRNYFNELRWKISRSYNRLQLVHQVTIEFRFRKSLAQEKFKSNLVFRYQIIVSSLKIRKGFATFMIPIALFIALPGKLDIKRHSPNILYLSTSLAMSKSVLKALPGKIDIKRHSPRIFYLSASITMSTSILKALPGKCDIKRHSPSTLY